MQGTIRVHKHTELEEDILARYLDIDQKMSSFDRNGNMQRQEDISSVSEMMLSQDLYSLIDAVYLETPVENFDNGDSEAFQCVIDDVIDALPSSDDFSFLDHIGRTPAWDIPVKNINSFVTGTACVYTCAIDKDPSSEQVTRVRTSSSTASTCNRNKTCDTLSPAENGLLAELSEFLVNTDSGLDYRPSIYNIDVASGRYDKRKRGYDSGEMPPYKKLRSEVSQSFLENIADNDQNGNLYRETICARGS